ncbi:MAG: methionine adenosyltransferase [Erysipelotrichaceae bacterium]
MNEFIFTSESVTNGHPDKVADQISDAILDALLAIDPDSRVACECCVTTNRVFVFGEITSKAVVDYEGIVRQVIREIGYIIPNIGFDSETCQIDVALDHQSVDIALGVDNLGAGDQGMMFGYATDESEDYLPLTLSYAHQLAKQLTKVRVDGVLPYLRPDGKTQVSIRYVDFKPVEITTIVISTQHDEQVTLDQIKKDLVNEVINQVIPGELLVNTKILINPTGRFVIGGPAGDSGLTGRKIIVDTYGGMAAHGGGAFSGKDPSKVDRSGAYMARYLAKNIVGAKLASRCQVQLAYAIGVAQPVSIYINTFNTGIIEDIKISKLVEELFDLTPKGIIDTLNLKSPIYCQLASYGQIGRCDLDLSFEKLDQVENFQKHIVKYQ